VRSDRVAVVKLDDAPRHRNPPVGPPAKLFRAARALATYLDFAPHHRVAKKISARFTATIVRLDGGARHHILPVPDTLAATFKAAKVRRLIGTVDGKPIKRALQSHADGGSFLILGQPLLRELGLKRGAVVDVMLRPDPAPDVVEVPDELLAVLAQDEPARERWETFTPGFQRSLAYYVTSAKQEPTRIKRSLELAKKIRTHSLHSDKLRRVQGRPD
jgi:hypothetical protein